MSKWDIINAKSMNYIFLGCHQLKPFTDIIKKKTRTEIETSEIFIIYDNKDKKKK